MDRNSKKKTKQKKIPQKKRSKNKKPRKQQAGSNKTNLIFYFDLNKRKRKIEPLGELIARLNLSGSLRFRIYYYRGDYSNKKILMTC